jgi:glycosyltransferase involved in cell wall biosynthesis
MPDVALVSLATTPGLRRADAAFAEQLRAAGVSCELHPVAIGRAGALRRASAVTDLVEALAARRAASGARGSVAVFSTVTAALLQPRRGRYAVRFDAPAALNRPGAGGAWQRARERRALSGAGLLLPWSEAAGRAAPGGAPRLVVPVPLPQLAGAARRDVDALAYAGNPHKRGLDALCRAWAAAGAGGRLVVGGIERERALAWLARRGVEPPAGVEWRGPLPYDEWTALVGRARLFVNASRWEDYGISQLEALSAGAALVTTPSPGPYEALALARRLAPRLVDADLASALAAGLALADAELSRYRVAAAAALAPYRPEAVQRTVAERVAPALATLGEVGPPGGP